MSAADYLKEAMKAKGLVAKRKLSAEALLVKIETETAWGWARGADSEGRLREELQALGAAMTPLHHDFVLLDPKAVKSSMSGAKYEEFIESFANLKPLIDKVAAKTASLLSMHKAR